MKRFTSLLPILLSVLFFACTQTGPVQSEKSQQPEENKQPEESKEPAAPKMNPTSISLESGECDFNITVTSPDLEYEVTLADDWITEVSRRGERATGETVTFHAQAHTGESARTGVVSFCTPNGNCYPVLVEQAAPAAPEDPENPEDPEDPENPEDPQDPQDPEEPQEPEVSMERHVLALRFTATWCQYCPYMDKAFQMAAAESEYFQYVALHGGGSSLYFQDGSVLENDYAIQGYPTGVVAGWKEINNAAVEVATKKNIVKAVNSFVEKFPCEAGIDIRPVIADGELQVRARVKSNVDASYSIVAVVLESDIVAAQTNGGPGYVHDNVARKTLSSSLRGEDFTIGAGETLSFNWTTSLSSSWKPENLSVLVWLYTGYGDLSDLKSKKQYPDTYIVNSQIVPVEAAE